MSEVFTVCIVWVALIAVIVRCMAINKPDHDEAQAWAAGGNAYRNATH
jgi:hypothetical protein